MLLSELTPDARDRLLRQSRPVRIPADTPIFRERQPADRFWIIESGRVSLHEHRPDHGTALIETLVSGDLLGCSGMLPPHHWRHGDHRGPRPRIRRTGRPGAVCGGHRDRRGPGRRRGRRHGATAPHVRNRR
ncbi:cyclic nucleotide-binding domain-containing protein [Streptomyces sp. NPDC087908]|uniref:cyclic nucleotide-binding domain-containing protein n=1 Tax=Streptomyces sp. NPDC087908 TaxID=3365820 RepID=UPI00381947E6